MFLSRLRLTAGLSKHLNGMSRRRPCGLDVTVFVVVNRRTVNFILAVIVEQQFDASDFSAERHFAENIQR